ncbi:MAG: signal peptidase I [Candidatus Omnitrophota bacterium]
MMESVDDSSGRKSLGKKAKTIHLQLLHEGREVYINTSGYSMYPFIKDGDIIKVAPVREEDLRIGDMLSIDNEGRCEAWFCVHRLVKITKKDEKVLYTTKGDANTKVPDRPVEFSRIAGKVIEIQRNDLRIDVGRGIVAWLNPRTALLSLRHPAALTHLAPYISLLVEWRWFFKKLMRRFRGQCQM